MHKIVNTTKPGKESLPGFFESENIQLDKLPSFKSLIGFDDAFLLENILSKSECQTLIDFMRTSDNFESVGVQGMMDKKDDKIGSLRTSIWSLNLAEQIWERVKHFLPNIFGTNFVATDWYQHIPEEIRNKKIIKYEPVAISPLLRFMEYGKGGQHYAHYDAGFIYPDTDYRSLKSMVIYLTTNENAATRFIDDQQGHLSVYERNHNDWSRETNGDEIIVKSECIQGNILFFDHRLCHDVEKYLGNDKRIIIRGDVIYKFVKY